MGFVANRQGSSTTRTDGDGQKPAGILYREGIAKIAAFSRACDADGIPIVWLQDISGFDIGVEAERQGLLGYGSVLIYTNSTNSVPMFTVLLRKASGAGYYAMAGLPYEPVVQLSTPLTRQSVMEGRTLAIAAFNTKLDDDFEIIAEDPEERAAIEQGMRGHRGAHRGRHGPVPLRLADGHRRDRAAQRAPGLARGCSRDGLPVQRDRRIKNPRIWSLHDLAALTEVRG